MTTGTLVSVAERRAMLKALGPRPLREEVEQAQQALIGIDAQLEEQLENTYCTAAPLGVNVAEWRELKESEVREAAEKEKAPYISAIQLDDLHQTYEDLLEQEEMALDGREAKDMPLKTDDKSNADASRLLEDSAENKAETLDLSKHSLSQVPEFLGRITTLISVDISSNLLQFLPDSVAGLVNLESLKVNSNQLKALPDSIGLLTKLKYLNVSSNTLKQLPESLGRCSLLVEIDANFNQLAFLSANFGELVNLEKLDLHLNKLSSIPASICELKSLKYIDLHMNKLRGLPSAIGNLSRLEYLDVSSNFNDLNTLPESVGDLTSLRYCDLSFNQIRVLPDSVGRLQNLATLKLDGNPMMVPPMEVVEHSHSAVMEHMQERWKQSLEEPLVTEDSTLFGGNQNSGWIPAWAGNSSVGTWIGSWWGSVGTATADSTVGLQERQGIHYLDQQL